MTTENIEEGTSGGSALTDGLGANYWKATANDPWGCEKRCIYCGAGDDAHHSFSCETQLHPDKRAHNVELSGG